MVKGYTISYWVFMKKFNLVAPLSVSIVVITLGAAFGVLSGMGAFTGMLSTSVIALITALVGGSRYGVSSLTSPMTAAIAVILAVDQKLLASHQGSLSLVELMNLTLLVAACFLLILTVLKVHKLMKLVPNLVISGFVNGIALLIIVTQFKTVSKMEDWILMFVTFVAAMLVSFMGRKFKHQVTKMILSSLSVIAVMSLLVGFLDLPASFLVIDGERAINFAFPAVELLDFQILFVIIPLAFELALIALLDTMFTSVIMDKKTKKKTDLTRELSGQGLSLFGMSLFGGIPGAQSTVPSILMWREGGHHRLSKLVLAIFCVAFTFLFTGLLQYVPMAVFGGIILKIAFDVADFRSLKSITIGRKRCFLRGFIVFGTMLSTVLLSLNLAVVGFTLIFVLWNRIMPKKYRVVDLIAEKEAEGLEDEV